MASGFPPAYVLDEMEPYEMQIALEGLFQKERESWEQTRQIVYSIVQVNSKNSVSPTEIMPLPWDEREERKAEESEEDYERLSNLMNQIIKEKHNAGGFSN